MSVRKDGRGRAFAPGAVATLGALVLTVLAVALAVWQVQRAHEKQMLENGYIDSMGGLPVAADGLSGTDSDRFQRVRLDGHFDGTRSFLIDNRTHEGRPGYEVVTPFLDRSGRGLLVDRGWLAAPISRGTLPTVETPEARVRAEAVVWPDTGLPPLLGEDAWVDGWPKRVQRLNVSRLGAAVGIDYPFVLRLEAGQPGALLVSTLTPRLSPARHWGYAVQWAALAVLVVVWWFVRGVRRGRTP